MLDPVLEVVHASPTSSELFCPLPNISPHAVFKHGKSTIRLSLHFHKVLIMTEHRWDCAVLPDGSQQLLLTTVIFL